LRIKTPSIKTATAATGPPMSEAPARHLNLAGASNFRDLGGYQTRDGRTVRWRQIFRSNHLAHLTEQDVAVVRGLGVRSAFDFRGVAERAEALCGMSDVTVHSLPVEPTVVAALREIASSRELSETDAIDVMRDSYRGYVQDNTPRYRTLFAHLLEDRAPLVIHCTAGKDRTGFAHSTELPDDVKQVLGTVRAAFLEASFAAIDTDYGNLDGYFREGLGLGPVERKALEGRYLQA